MGLKRHLFRPLLPLRLPSGLIIISCEEKLYHEKNPAVPLPGICNVIGAALDESTMKLVV